MRMWTRLCLRYPVSAGINLMQIWIGLDWSAGSLIRRGLLLQALVDCHRRDFGKVKMEVGGCIEGWRLRVMPENTLWIYLIRGEDKGEEEKRGLIDMIAQQGFQKWKERERERGREFSETPDWAANHSQPRMIPGPRRACCYGNVIIAGAALIRGSLLS